MKKTFKTMLALMAGAMVFTACNKDDIYENIDEQNPSELKSMTFTASMEGQEGATRATIDGLDIKWTTGDKISIFDGAEENNGNQEFTLATGEGTTSATFTGSAATASTYYALYPYETSRTVTREEALAAWGEDESMFEDIEESWQMYSETDTEMAVYMVKDYMEMYDISEENQAIILAYLKNEPIVAPGAKLEGNIIKEAVLPAEQTVTDGQYVDPKAMLMIAQSDDANSLKFKNVCAYVKVTPKFDCSAIVIKSNATQNLAGTITMDYNSGTPTASVTANGTNKVTLSGAIAANTAYYIAVLPATFSSGFTLTFKASDGKYEKSTTKTLTLTRSHITNLGSFAKSDLTNAIAGSAYAAEPDCEVGWVQLWEDGPRFAVYNIGVTDGKAESYGGYYTWGGTVDQDPNKVYWNGEKLDGHDTATLLWGNKWRMPTKAELEALTSGNKCTCTWTTNYNNSGKNGLLFTGMGDYSSNSVFLPAAGKYEGQDTFYERDKSGYYWSSSPNGTAAYCLVFDRADYLETQFGYGRNFVHSVRAVLAE